SRGFGSLAVTFRNSGSRAFLFGARTRMSASFAISRARRRARSESPPSARAWMRQILRNRNCRLFDGVSSPNTSMYFCVNWPPVIRLSLAMCCSIVSSSWFFLLGGVNLVYMRARLLGGIKWRSAAPRIAQQEIAGCENARDGLEILGWDRQDGSPRCGLGPR